MEVLTGVGENGIKSASTTHFKFPAQSTVSISKKGFFVITGVQSGWEYNDGTFLSAYIKDGVLYSGESPSYGGIYTSLSYNAGFETLSISQYGGSASLLIFITKIS